MARPGQPGAGMPSQAPISFKTVPGRNRTQKWNQAKTYNYDGDDWAGYDPYDEYGGDVKDASAASSGPYPQPAIQRQQSFESGNERRQFSAPHPAYQEDRSRSPAKSTGSSGYSDRERPRRREYSNPAQVPPPLNTRSSPARPIDSRSRKSSLSSEHGHADGATPVSAKPDKPLPFIRPSDIYKRVAEEKEKERQSSESSRPSMDSIQREGTPGGSQRPLSTVQERPGSGEMSTLIHPAPSDSLHPGYGAAQPSTMLSRPVLPPVGTVSDFGMDVLQAGNTTHQYTADAPEAVRTAPSSQQATSEPSHDETSRFISPATQFSNQHGAIGLQNVVQTAFDRHDSTASSQNGAHSADFSRSNTNSTSSISPIMSRVPSSGTSAMRQPERDTIVPPIPEEPASTHSRSASGETVVAPSHHRFNSLAAASHESAPASTDNSDRRSFNASSLTPSGSPARAPAMETVEPRRLSNPMSAEIASANAGGEAAVVGRPRRGTDYSIREADLAQEASSATSPVQSHELAQTEKAMQQAFLNEHTSGTTPRGADHIQPPNTAEHIPAQPESLASISSPAARAEPLAVPPQPERSNSFQPHMPGEWISPAPTPATEISQPSMSRPLGGSRMTHETVHSEKDLNDETQPDFAPTASRAPQTANASVSDTIAAVKDAGSALGAALLSNVGLGHQARDFGSSEPAQPVEQPASHPRNQSGLITSRLPLSRELSDAPTEDAASVASDIPPTPPAKDKTSQPGTSAAIESYFGSATAPSPLNPHHNASKAVSVLSADTSNSEYESDRLRKDIEQSLNEHSKPAFDNAAVATQPSADGLAAPGNQHIVDAAPTTLQSAGATTDARQGLPSNIARPALLDQRFSWESQHVTVNRPLPPMAVVGELPGDKDRQSYERPPDGHGLHVVNAPVAEVVSPISVDQFSQVQDTSTATSQNLDLPTGESIKRNELSPSPVSLDESSHIPSYYAGVTGAPLDISEVSVNHTEVLTYHAQGPVELVRSSSPVQTQVQQATSSHQSGRVPPFREILAIKEAPDRIKTYSDTRQSFAEMNTGLANWMSVLLAKHPEHADLVTSTGGYNAPSVQIDSGSMGRGHRHNASLLKIKQLAGNLDPARSNSDSAPDASPKDHSDGSRLQMEKMQAKGKDLMKSASAFGGKAQAGAMGLLAKGRSRFGRGDKAQAPTPPPITTSRRVSRPLPSPTLAAELARDFTGSNHAATFGERSANREGHTDKADDSARLTKQDTPVSTTVEPTETDKEGRPGFLARLRSRSRSLTRSLSRPNSVALAEDGSEIRKARTNSRSRSRPGSLVLLSKSRSDDATTGTKTTAALEDIPAVPTFQYNMTQAAQKTLTEAWDDNDALPRLSEGNEDGSGRMGVLPSPSTFTFSEHSTDSQRPRTNSLAARLAEREDLRELARPDTGRSSANAGEAAGEPGNKIEHMPDDADQIASPSKLSRRLSDLSTLPSQLKAPPPVPDLAWSKSVTDKSARLPSDAASKRYSLPLQAALLKYGGSVPRDDMRLPDTMHRRRSDQNTGLPNAVEHPPVVPSTTDKSSTAIPTQSFQQQSVTPSKMVESSVATTVEAAEHASVLPTTVLNDPRAASAGAMENHSASSPLVGDLPPQSSSQDSQNKPELELISSPPAGDHLRQNDLQEDQSRSEHESTSLPLASERLSQENLVRPKHESTSLPLASELPNQENHLRSEHETAALPLASERRSQGNHLRSEHDATSLPLADDRLGRDNLLDNQPRPGHKSTSSPSAAEAPRGDDLQDNHSTSLRNVAMADTVAGAEREPTETTHEQLMSSSAGAQVSGGLSPALVSHIDETAGPGLQVIGRTVDSDRRSIVSAEDENDISAEKRSIVSDRSAVSSLGKPEPAGTVTIVQPTIKERTYLNHAQNNLATPQKLSQAPSVGSYATVFAALDDLDIVPALRVSQELSRLDGSNGRYAQPPQNTSKIESRPLASSLPLSDGRGGPLQQSVRGTGEGTSRVDDSNLDGPPTGASSTQLHPLLREGEQGVIASPIINRGAAKPRLSATTFPSSSQIDDQYGLEDAQIASPVDDTISTDVLEKKSRRKSGLWGSFRRVSSSGKQAESGVHGDVPPVPTDSRRASVMGLSARPSKAVVAAPGDSRRRSFMGLSAKPSEPMPAPIDSRRRSLIGLFVKPDEPMPPAPTDSQPRSLLGLSVKPDEPMPPASTDSRRRSFMGLSAQPDEPTSRPKTLKKPQRSVSSAAEPDDGKRRSSGLGSLFGRSSTQGHAATKSNKLAKKAHATPEPQVRIEHPAQGYYRQPAVHTNYQDFEAARRREAAEQAVTSAIEPVKQTSPHEHYGVADAKSSAGATRTSPRSPQPPHLQGEEYWNNKFRHVPEAFRPVDASFGRNGTVGPPIERHGSKPNSTPDVVGSSRPNWPLRGDSFRYEQDDSQQTSRHSTHNDRSYSNAARSYDDVRPPTDQQAPWTVSLPPRDRGPGRVQARTTDTYTALPTLVQPEVPHRASRVQQLSGHNPRDATNVSRLSPLYSDNEGWIDPHGPPSTSNEQYIRPLQHYEAKMRGASYPGQEWMPSVHEI